MTAGTWSLIWTPCTIPRMSDHPPTGSATAPGMQNERERGRQEQLLDQELDESFPASDPTSAGSVLPVVVDAAPRKP